jgi:CRP-like cAMP-binding protein
MMVEILGKIIAHPEFPEGSAWQRHALPANEVILREGEEGGALFFIERGELRVTGRVELEEERHVQLGICDLAAGDVFGEMSLFGNRMRTASVAALTEVVVVELDGEALGRFLDGHPELGYRFLQELSGILAGRLSRTNRQMEHLFAWGLRVHDIPRFL